MRRILRLATVVMAPVVAAGLAVVGTATSASAAYAATLPALLRQVEDQTAVQIRAYDPSTLPIPSCDAPGISLCLDNPTWSSTLLAVPSVDLNPTVLSHVTAYLKFYEIEVGDTGTGLFPCVVMAAPGSADGCALLGLDPSGAADVPLVDEDVARFDPTIGPTLVTIGVCSATLQLKADGDDAFHTEAKTVCTS